MLTGPPRATAAAPPPPPSRRDETRLELDFVAADGLPHTERVGLLGARGAARPTVRHARIIFTRRYRSSSGRGSRSPPAGNPDESRMSEPCSHACTAQSTFLNALPRMRSLFSNLSK